MAKCRHPELLSPFETARVLALSDELFNCIYATRFHGPVESEKLLVKSERSNTVTNLVSEFCESYFRFSSTIEIPVTVVEEAFEDKRNC